MQARAANFRVRQMAEFLDCADAEDGVRYSYYLPSALVSYFSVIPAAVSASSLAAIAARVASSASSIVIMAKKVAVSA